MMRCLIPLCLPLLLLFSGETTAQSTTYPSETTTTTYPPETTTTTYPPETTTYPPETITTTYPPETTTYPPETTTITYPPETTTYPPETTTTYPPETTTTTYPPETTTYPPETTTTYPPETTTTTYPPETTTMGDFWTTTEPMTTTTFSETDTSMITTTTPEFPNYDPCENYTALDDIWRTTYSYQGSGYYLYGYSGYYGSHDDTTIEWDGWYRLYLNGENARMSEWCVYYMTSGGYTPLLLSGTHPLVKDGIVTREIQGSYYYYWWYNGWCGYYRSSPIQIKACPGHYYVYRLVKPDISIPMPIYTAVAERNVSYDPCDNYTSLDQPWRATTASGMSICDYYFSWNGWYRLLYHGKNIRMPESCVDVNRCGSYYTLWLNGPHPEVEDGIVTRQVCGNAGYDCCYFKSNPIRVKACPGNYYVYEFVKPEYCNAAYCADASTINEVPTTTPSDTDVTTTTSDIWTTTEPMTTTTFSETDTSMITSDIWTTTEPMTTTTFSETDTSMITSDFWTTTEPMTTTTLSVTDTSPTTTTTTEIPKYDPCENYTARDDIWRTTYADYYYSYYNYNYYYSYGFSSYYSSHDDTTIEWDGWYRLYLNGENAQIAEWCVNYMTSGGYTPLLLSGTHPLVKDGIVTREIQGSYHYYWWYSGWCGYYRSNPIQVKACPGHYYVYRLVKPDISIPLAVYAAVRSKNVYGYDPCNNYVTLDQPWRATNATGLNICDYNFNWNGWYRLLYHGMNIQMPESCVDVNRCGSYYTLWLNGPHPEVEDGVVTRQVCGNAGYDCCYFKPNPIRVKACPGDYYVYEFVKPYFCNAAYCADINTASPTPAPSTESPVTTTEPDNSTFDPCNSYTVLDDYWRSSQTSYSYGGNDDTIAQWNGWYRMYLQGASAQLTEWCVSYMSCGGYTPLSLGGAHPQEGDGIVTRDVYGSSGGQCTAYKSNPIQVKACPGGYYVYKFVKPDVSIPMPSYCAVTVNHPSYDPCNKYTPLDQPWRSTNESGMNICDYYFNWNGWYRLLYHGMNIRMPENCVDVYRCGSYYTLWLNGPHPEVEDGVVTRQVCGNAGYDCYYFRSLTIQVKACPGNYYVYEFTRPSYCNMAYCADVNTITPSPAPTTVATEEISTNTTVDTTTYDYDPCENHTALDDSWRTMYSVYGYNSHDDTLVDWDGWYRLYLNGKSAQIPDWCTTFMSCGGYTPLLLNGPHPRISDGIVTREVYGSINGQCHQFRSNSIQVKACPGNYYTYRLVKPDVSVPMPTYCTVAFNQPSYDPCNNYTTLDQPWRSKDASGLNIYDSYFSWNGWYRLLYHGMNIQMAESCVDVYRCGTYYTLWLNSPHPQVEDGVVARQVCANRGYGDCCYFNFLAIQVKACPGNYYVYEFVSPTSYSYNNYVNNIYNYYYYNNYYYFNYYYSAMAYCTDLATLTPTPTPTMGQDDTTTTSADFDPCYSYTAVDDYWRNIRNSYYSGHDDTVPDWNGWYRLYLNGASAQISEWCVSYMTCGGYTPLVLGGPHPKLEDGIVTREVRAFSGGQCNSVTTSTPIQVKACPGHYYVYKLVKPDVSIPMPTYCAVIHAYPSNDPCYDHTVLDQPWRATNNTYYYNYYYYGYWWWYWWVWCDSYTSWNGWYRLLYQGKDIRMPESCVAEGRCGTHASLWLRGPHPKQEDGVVSRQVCGSWAGDCCYFKSFPIQVKACPGKYYVYEFVSPSICHSAYCADIDSIASPEASTGGFYPFGDGDPENQRVDEGSSGAITLQQPFKYFGKTQNQVYVNNNGHLTFDQAWTSIVPYQFPANGGRDIIAPFWTDLDNSIKGVISYQQYTSGNVLTQATQDINQYFPELSFNATWVFVATWYRVAYQSHGDTETSFQVVLISNGNLSFILMNYGLISPTSRNVQAGYDTDDSSYYFSLPGAFQYNYTSFTYSSNVNVTGRWAFRVDEGSQTCEFNGNTMPLGTSFWTDDSCFEKCTCTRKGLRCKSEPCTFSQACRPAALQYRCQNIQRQTCTISGDPHYYTFDNQVFHFQGTCTYVLSQACGDGLPYYRVEGKNENRGSTYVSWTRLVRVVVYDTELELVRDHPYEAKVNGGFATTPFSLHNGSIQVYQSGFSVAISTAFGLVVTYDAYHYVTISVPYDYQGATCGLCGNFNHHPEDDFRTPLGQVMYSDIDFANSWMAFGDTDETCKVNQCSGLACAGCSTEQSNLYSNSDYCGILSDASGPFATCHTTLASKIFRENCVYDLCVGDGYKRILCQALNVYAAQCQQLGINLGEWRRPGLCEIQCPANSHYESQGTSCPAACSNPSAPINCPLPPQESCICDEGYVLSAGECVLLSNCGCTFEGLYYADGQSVVLDEDCGRKCTCSNGTMICHNHQCSHQETCGFYNGVRGCRPTSYATCWVERQSTYHTFDGLKFSYPGACELILSRVMGLSLLPNFAVTVQKVLRGPQGFSRLLRFDVEGTQVSIEMGEGGMAQVDGQMVALPYSAGSGRILIYHSSVKGIIMETSFGVTVRVDWPHLIRITAPNTYNGTLGGLCGNFNENRNDEFYSPIGILLNSTQEFGDSWRDGSLSAHCVESDHFGGQGYYQNSTQFNQLCRIMGSTDGPFAQCHRTLDPREWIADCTRYLEQTGGAREALCEAIRSYAVLCQQNGVRVGEWRNVTNCDLPCTANSHYEVCGTSCPSACPSLSFPFSCTQHCQEGCQCDDGLVLSGDQCVSPTGCGCLHNGRYRHAGEHFWSDEQCQSYCFCDGTTSFVNCSSSSCKTHETCRVVDGEYGCHPRPSATCSASGDPHYTSFDGQRFDFQGTCRYVLATVCNDSLSLPYFEVIGRNEQWLGLPVSITVEVSVNVSGHLVRVSQNMYGTAEIDGVTRNLPVLLDLGTVSVYSSGPNTFITTDFGLSVSYDGSWVVTITVPGNFTGATCGLCGNFNSDSNDDFRIHSGTVVSSAVEFGADWKVENDTSCQHGCVDSCPPCPDQSKAESMCEIIRDIQGPLSFCNAYVDPQAYFTACVFDVCTSQYSHDVLCHSVETYVSACHSANIRIFPWRESTSCNIPCFGNSHYELCGTDCGHTCASSVDAICERTCTEGCFCDNGFVRSGGDCVPVQQCGCLYDGFYFHIGDQFWTEGCSQRCECFAPNDIRCFYSSCTPTQECAIRNGHLGCYSQMSMCMVSGDPHYFTYDGAVTHFQGTCSYEISQTCGNATESGLEFRVVATNMHRGSRSVSFVSAVDVWLSQHGQNTHITIGQSRRVKVDNTSMDSFPYQISSLAEIYHEQNFVVVNASSELMVYFDGIMTLLVKLGPRFHGSVCGMCGNNNGNPADDKSMPGGLLASDDYVFGNSWRADTSSEGCGAMDLTPDPDCPFRNEYSELCSVITNTSGFFQHCHAHINPEPYFTSCVYDMCSYSDKNLFHAVVAYEIACTMIDLKISPEWCAEPDCLRNSCENLNCTENEWCGQTYGIYGCFCNENHPRTNADLYDSKELCESSSGTMSLSRCQLFEAGFSDQGLHLSDTRCKGTVENGRVVFHFDNDGNICGTYLTANGTHFIYNNTIIGEADLTGDTINRNKILELSFSCVYQLRQTITMDTEFNPIESRVSKTIPNGEGMYHVRMISYQDAGFSHPYTGRVSIDMGQRIYVAVRVEGVDSRQIATVVDSCWATPENDANYAVRWDLIINRCANSKDKTVELIENGVSTSGRFSFNMFTFTNKSGKVFLHCSIHLCLVQTSNCAARCHPGHNIHRVGRTVDVHDSASISMGPFIWSTNMTDE